ncbi:MAG: hypothetical protein L3J89_03585 [Gammaproteobacteria bacterium]|nr:hypothetical protein [Gammaproteobacteria bacterium]
MNTHAEKTQRNKSPSIANEASRKKSGGESDFQFIDSRAEAITQRNLQEMANNSPPAQLTAQLQAIAYNYSSQQPLFIQKKENKKGKCQEMVNDHSPVDGKLTSISQVALRVMTGHQHPVQRAIIAHGPIDGLTANLDTAHKNASKAQIDEIWNGGKLAGLASLNMYLGNANPENHPNNNRALRQYISRYLSKKREDDSNAGIAGFLETTAFDLMNPADDETGIVNQPGIGEQVPNPATARQTYALNVRSWQIGDIVDGVSWSTLASHLQGRLGAADYVRLGDDILIRRDVQNGTNLQATTGPMQKVNIAQASLLRVKNEIGTGLNGLPAKAGVSYRAATAAVGVYGGTVNVGSYIKDMSFWSTSGLKLSHQGHNFGDEGTLTVPKVYFIITGSSGVFVPRFTNKETGVREVLFKDQTIFEVTKVTNYANRTFFVYVTETDPATLPNNQVTKNPWSGANN